LQTTAAGANSKAMGALDCANTHLKGKEKKRKTPAAVNNFRLSLNKEQHREKKKKKKNPVFFFLESDF
jgi:hypothetical protein